MKNSPDAFAKYVRTNKTWVSEDLRRGLMALRNKIDDEIEALNKGAALDAHLIVSAGYLTADVAKWNMFLEMTARSTMGDEER